MRTKLVAGNWKMYKTPGEAQSLASDLKGKLSSHTGCDVVVCPPYTALDRVNQAIGGTSIKLGAQDLHWEDQGAFTGKISHDMLKDVGCDYVIIGHSEQRQYFHETDDTVNKKTGKALATRLTPIVCVGETLAEREANKIDAVVGTQIKGAYAGLTRDQALQTVIAYEPVWAIGTGKTASPEQAQEVHELIRKLMTELYDATTAESIRILYGGSVKPGNAAELFSQKDIDGGLIGGASLKADDFEAIVKAAS